MCWGEGVSWRMGGREGELGSGYDSGHIRCTPFHNPDKLHTNSSGFSAETPKVYCDTDFALFSDRFAFSMEHSQLIKTYVLNIYWEKFQFKQSHRYDIIQHNYNLSAPSPAGSGSNWVMTSLLNRRFIRDTRNPWPRASYFQPHFFDS